MSERQYTVMGTDGRAVVDFELLSLHQRVAQAMQTAWNLGVWQQLLAAPSTAEAVAGQAGLDPTMTDRLLRVLAATGLAYRQPDGVYRLTAEGRAAFDPASDRYYGDGLGHAAGIGARWAALAESLRTAPYGHTGAPSMPPEVHRTFVMAMQDYSIRGRAQWLAGNLDLGGRRHLLDFGGGPGTYAFALLEVWPELRATVFDLPATESLLRANAERYGLSDRVDFRGGNFDTDELGGGYDCALASNVLHGAHHNSAARTRRLCGAMAPGGLVIVQDFVLDDDGNGPLEAAMFGLHVGAYTVGEMIALLREAGLTDVTLQGRGPAGNGLFTGVVP